MSRARRIAHLAALIGAPGCNALLGIDSFSVGPDASEIVDATGDAPPARELGFVEPRVIGPMTHPNAIALGVLDIDERPDLVITDATTNVIAIFPSTLQGFGPPVELAVSGPVGVAVADFDGDNQRDLVVITSTDLAQFFLNTGAGFTAGMSLGVGHIPRALALGDFDSTTSDDVAVVATDRLTIFAGTTLRSAIPLTSAGTAIAVGSLDGDGNRDLAIATASLAHVSRYLGNGLGTFADAGSFDTNASPLAIAIADFDTSATDDYVVTFDDASACIYYANAGAVGPCERHATGANPVAVLVADLDRDSKPDIVVANHEDASLTILTGAHPNEPLVIQLGGRPVALADADLDLDGRLDLAIATSDSGVILLYQERGP